MSRFANDQCGFVPSPANPYTDHSDQYRGPVEVPEPVVLTMRDVDRMVRAKLDDARRESRAETRRECEQAWETGRWHGNAEGRQYERKRLTDAVNEVLQRRLGHTDRKLRERADKQRTTIAAEREFIAQIREEVSTAISRLFDVGVSHDE